jgi:hypothetical protein
MKAGVNGHLRTLPTCGAGTFVTAEIVLKQVREDTEEMEYAETQQLTKMWRR